MLIVPWCHLRRGSERTRVYRNASTKILADLTSPAAVGAKSPNLSTARLLEVVHCVQKTERQGACEAKSASAGMGPYFGEDDDRTVRVRYELSQGL